MKFIYFNNNNYYYYYYYYILYTIQIVEKTGKRSTILIIFYPYNCLITYIKHMNSAIEGATKLRTCITIPHLIKKDIVTVIEEKTFITINKLNV